MSTEKQVGDSGANQTELSQEEDATIQIGDDSTALTKQSEEEHISASLIKEEDENELETSTVELPRDILTAYILIRLLVAKDSKKGSAKMKFRWDELSRVSKGCILFGLIGSYTMQFAVFFSFTANLDFSNYSTSGTEPQDWWFNLISIAALFMYLWKDVIAFYNSVWFWIGKIEEERGITTSPDKLLGKMGHQLKDAATVMTKKDKEKDKEKEKIEATESPSSSRAASISPKAVLENMSFLQFRVGLIAVFVLYGGYAMYSLLAIGNTNSGDLVEKMSVAIQIFFILEIDDWACSLFILNPGVLDDGDFDQDILVNANKEAKRVQRRLVATTVILIVSILSVYALIKQTLSALTFISTVNMAICTMIFSLGFLYKLSDLIQTASIWAIFCSIISFVFILFISKRIFMHFKTYGQYFSGGNSIFLNPFIIYSKPSNEWLPPLTNKLKIGDILVRDFRKNKECTKQNDSKRIKILSFNIEKGRKIDEIIKLFKSLNADIYCLQEVDINTQRAFYVDVLGEIANELELNSFFACEQIISSDPFHWKDGKKPLFRGYEGTAILTKYDFVSTKGLVLDCVRTKKKHKYGRHNECCCTVKINDSINIGVYSLHLEPHHCGVNGRVKQYLQCLEDVKRQRVENELKYQILCGDFNTVVNGIARLNFGIAPDYQSIIGTLGISECEWFNLKGVTYGNIKYGLDFSDPFDKNKDFTFHSFKGLYKGKLDWCLLSRSFEVLSKRVGSVENRCSDHQWIIVEVALK